ncbi:hypothetical protein M0654_22390, partial [Rhizobium sp. NTR19]
FSAQIPGQLSVQINNISQDAEWKFHVFVAWSFISIWGFLSFLRVAYIFGDIVKVKDRPRVAG